MSFAILSAERDVICGVISAAGVVILEALDAAAAVNCFLLGRSAPQTRASILKFNSKQRGSCAMQTATRGDMLCQLSTGPDGTQHATARCITSRLRAILFALPQLFWAIRQSGQLRLHVPASYSYAFSTHLLFEIANLTRS